MNKKKVFSYLFIGLLAVGATGTVTSCKDYDDDINTNKSAITELQKQLTTLQSALDQAKKDAETAHAQFATKGDIESLQTQISKLATADALQKAIDQLKELIDARGCVKTPKNSQSPDFPKPGLCYVQKFLYL